MTMEYLYKACTYCGAGAKGKDIPHTWDCPNNPRNKVEKPMTYQEAREKTAQYLLDNVCSNYKYEWCNASEGDRDAFRQYANELLQLLLTRGMTDPDQSYPQLTMDTNYNNIMTDFRKVVTPQSEEVENEWP